MAEDKRTPEEKKDSGTSEPSSKGGSERYEACPDEGFTPSSPVKRTLAWVGLVYALILLALTTYFFFTAKGLSNLGPLLTVPGLIGLGAVALVSWRSTGKPEKWPAIALAVLCWLLALATLPIGIAGLMSNFSQFGVTVITTTGG